MVKGLGEVLRTAAGTHVETVRNESRRETRVSQAHNISGIPAPFQAVHKYHFRSRMFRPLGFDEHLRVGVRPTSRDSIGQREKSNFRGRKFPRMVRRWGF